MHSVSGTLASVVCGLPYALAAQIAFPKRQVVAFVRDGGYSMLMGDLATAIRYRLPIKVVVVKINYLGQIRWEQMVFLGNPETRSTCNQLISPRTPNPCARGFRIDNPADCGRILYEALAAPGPVVAEAIVDPNENEPPLPPRSRASKRSTSSRRLPAASRID
jgi:pyruvate dehydrogenase (quinone)/pyruvate oxidase